MRIRASSNISRKAAEDMLYPQKLSVKALAWYQAAL
jgi:hypothetical protein